MDTLARSLGQAFQLLATGDLAVFEITARSLQVSVTATLASLVVGLPLGAWLALARFPGRRLVLGAVNAGMGMPPVVAGLVITVLLWRSGPLGQLHLLYTPAAIVVAQCVIAAPIVTALTVAAMQHLNPRLHLQILSLGATRWQMLWLLIRETRLPLLAAIMAAFGAVISEVGASMMVGGNIPGQTRVLTTATVLETSKGNFDLALALGFLLLALIYGVNVVLTWIQQRERPL